MKSLVEIERYAFFVADTNISKIFKSCFLLHYQKYDVFMPYLVFKTLKIRIYKLEFLKLQQVQYLIILAC